MSFMRTVALALRPVVSVTVRERVGAFLAAFFVVAMGIFLLVSVGVRAGISGPRS